MTLDILTPEKELYSGEVRLIKVPGINGAFEIMNNHAPIISTLTNGDVKIIDLDGNEETFSIKGGVIEQADNKIIVLAD